MKKVYVIVINDVYDSTNYPHAPEVYADIEKAKARLKELHDNVENMDGDEYIHEVSDTEISIYEEGYYSENHYTAYISEAEVK